MFFFFNDTATTEIYTLSLHDALPISNGHVAAARLNLRAGDELFCFKIAHDETLRKFSPGMQVELAMIEHFHADPDRKSTRLNSSHANISYAVFCLKKKKNSLLHHTDA